MKECSAFLEVRDARVGFLQSAPEINYLKTCSANFSQSIECFIPPLYPRFPLGGFEGQQSQPHMI